MARAIGVAVEPPFLLIAASLREGLQQVTLEQDRLLEASKPRLTGTGGFLPEWLALRSFGIRWHCQSRFAGDQSRFLFWEKRASGREMLDAEIELNLGPSPLAEPPPLAPTLEGTRLVFPRIMRRDFTAEEFIRWTPPQAGLRQSVILALGPSQILGASDMRPDRGDELAEHTRARWTRGDTHRDFGPRGRWPLTLFLVLVRALAADTAALPGDVRPYAALNTKLEVWQIAQDALRLALGLSGWLEPRPGPVFDHLGAFGELIEPLRSRWGVGRFALRAGALVNKEGGLAAARDDDTFLAPFQVHWEDALDGPRLSVRLEPPDVVARGELRERLLAAFTRLDAMGLLAKRFNRAVPGAGLTRDDIVAWCDPENPEAQVVRVDRRKAGPDEYLLVLGGRAGSRPVVGLIQSETKVLAFEEGRLVVELTGWNEVFAGLETEMDLEWEPGGRLLCDLLSILLRWRSLLP